MQCFQRVKGNSIYNIGSIGVSLLPKGSKITFTQRVRTALLAARNEVIDTLSECCGRSTFN